LEKRAAVFAPANLGVARAASLRNNPGVQLATRLNCAAILVAMALAAKTFAQTALLVYDDGLQSGFEDWPWASHSLTNTSPVHSGVYSISVHAAAWQGLYLHHAAFDTSPYTSLSFWGNGGIKGGQRLQVQVLLGNANPPANVYFRFTLLPATWQQITVPLAALDVANRTNCTGFWIQLTTNSPSGTFYVDDIQFNAKPAPAPTAANTNAVTNAMAAPVSPSGFAQPISTNFSLAVYPAIEAKALVGETKTISGVVAQVTARENMTYLNFDKPYPDMPFTGVIFASRTNQFSNLQNLEGRRVLITGKITQHDGRPEIIIDSTNQLKVMAGPVQLEANTTSRKSEQTQASTVIQPVVTPVQPAGNVPQSEVPIRAGQSNSNVAIWFIAGALLVITALLVWLIVMVRRSGLGRPKALLPALPPAALQIGPGLAVDDAPGSPPNLLASETIADPQVQALREKMASELTEFAKQSLVQGLYSQRNKLIEAQQKAQQELAELEARLNSLHLPLQERIRAYEARIAELEKQLETRDEELREMIRATLLLIRERMEKEKAGEYDIPRFN
jgi:DNA/RNA endonuclease YhcR with UshA esterase domain